MTPIDRTPTSVRPALRGALTALVTPLAADGAVDLATLRQLVRWQVLAGIDGLVPVGTTGEAPTLNRRERERVIETVVETVAERPSRARVPVVPGTGTNDTAATVAATRRAARLGADAALIIVPYYNRPSQEGLYRYFRALAESVDLPLIIYNIPGRTGVNMAPATMARLRRDAPMIVGVKESNKDFEHVSMVLHACGREFLVYSGIELLCYPMLAIGGVGHVSATANILPREVADLYNHVAAGRWGEAIDLHYRLLRLNEVLFLETNPGPLKWAMGRLGRITPYLRPPLCEPSAENQARIEAVLQSYDLVSCDGAM